MRLTTIPSLVPAVPGRKTSSASSVCSTAAGSSTTAVTRRPLMTASTNKPLTMGGASALAVILATPWTMRVLASSPVTVRTMRPCHATARWE